MYKDDINGIIGCTVKTVFSIAGTRGWEIDRSLEIAVYQRPILCTFKGNLLYIINVRQFS
jgi:hypothetical protein